VDFLKVQGVQRTSGNRGAVGLRVIDGLWAGAACEWPMGESGRGPVQPTTVGRI
jgi:hypothetical protein